MTTTATLVTLPVRRAHAIATREPMTVRGAARELLRAIAHACLRSAVGAMRRVNVRAGIAEMRELEDRMLRDIGIARADVERIARGYDPRA